MEENRQQSTSTKRTAIIIVLLFAAFFAGMQTGRSRISEAERAGAGTTSLSTDFEPFWRAWNVINEKSPFVDGVSDQQKVYGAIDGLAASLGDPYTDFFTPEETVDFEQSLSGEFEGVGMELGEKDGVLTVVAPLKDTPADRGGIRPGDIIMKIDDTIAADMTVDEAIKLIRGKAGTSVRLTVLAEGEEEPKEIVLTRERIDMPIIETEKRTDGVFVIRLYSFSADSANRFHDALAEFARSGSNRLVLDLRSNPGGFLDAAIDMASWFLPLGTPVVIEDFGENAEQHTYRSKGYELLRPDVHMAILVDGGSASASEILAGALSEHGKATLVGETTYGKGSVQEVVEITPDTALKITVAKWLTPKGVSISEKGIDPDVRVSITEADIKAGRDPQFDRAVAELKK